MLFRVAEGPTGAAVDAMCRDASQAIKDGYKFLILSDRGSTKSGRRYRVCWASPQFITISCASVLEPRWD